MKQSIIYALPLIGAAAARPELWSLNVKREVPQEHSHRNVNLEVSKSLNLNNPDKIQDPIFGLLGAAAGIKGAGNIKDADCLQQATADQAFTNAKAANDVNGMTFALIYRALERNTGSVGLASVPCKSIKAVNPEIAALQQHQDPASDGAAELNKSIAKELAKQIAAVGGDPALANEASTFAPGKIGDKTGAGNTCDDDKDDKGCINTQKLRVDDLSAAEIQAAAGGAVAAAANGTAVANNGTAAADQKAGGKKDAADQKAADKQAAADKKAADKQAAADKKAAEKQAAADQKAADQAAADQQKAAEQQAAAGQQNDNGRNNGNGRNNNNNINNNAALNDAVAQILGNNNLLGGNAASNLLGGNNNLLGGNNNLLNNLLGGASSRASGIIKRQATGFGSCADPSIKFGIPSDGRKEQAFEASDLTNFPHGSALNIGVISSFICDQLTNKCKASADAVTKCDAADAASKGLKGQAAADAFNKALGV